MIDLDFVSDLTYTASIYIAWINRERGWLSKSFSFTQYMNHAKKETTIFF